MDAKNGMRPVHPGEVLREELDDLGLSANALSKALGVPVNRVTMILNGQRDVSGDTALRLARHFGTTPQFLDEPAEDMGAAPSGDRDGSRDRRARDGACRGRSKSRGAGRSRVRDAPESYAILGAQKSLHFSVKFKAY